MSGLIEIEQQNANGAPGACYYREQEWTLLVADVTTNHANGTTSTRPDPDARLGSRTIEREWWFTGPAGKSLALAWAIVLARQGKRPEEPFRIAAVRCNGWVVRTREEVTS
jgi:hypothetical protein